MYCDKKLSDVLVLAAFCRLLLKKEGALDACKSLLRDRDTTVSMYCLKVVTMFAQSQYRKST